MVTKDVFDNATALDAAKDVFDRYPKGSNHRVEKAFACCQLTATRFLFGLIRDDACGFIPLKVGILCEFGQVGE
jgi:hypothetical protein